MNVRRRAVVDAAIVFAIVFVTSRVMGAAELPIGISFVVLGAGTLFVVHDVFRAGFEGRPLWRWSWLDEGLPPPEPR